MAVTTVTHSTSKSYTCVVAMTDGTSKAMPDEKTYLYHIIINNQTTMNIGDKAPEILGKDEQGRDIRLSDYRGRKLALYFYPKDNTSGCTAEACSLRDHYGELQAEGYEVVGVSKDSAASHVKFKEKHELPFPLIADVDKSLMEAMGAWGEKTMYGKKTMGTIRTTFIINEEGVIEQIFAGKKVNTKQHAEQILNK